MYCKGTEGKCSNCGHEAYDHTFDFVLGNNGASVGVSVDNACTLQEAVKEARSRLSEGVSQMFDISNGEIDNSMTCVVKSIEFEDLGYL
jgi:hypothetical protein